MTDYHGPPTPTFLEAFMINKLVFRWPKPVFFMVLGAHGSGLKGDFLPKKVGESTTTRLSKSHL